MSADPFNSLAGYTVGIPPIQVVDANGNVTSNNAFFTQLSVTGNASIGGNVSAQNFIGDIYGNVHGYLAGSSHGNTTEVYYNSNGNLNADPGFTFDSTKQLVTIKGDLVANTLTLGSGNLEFVTTSAIFANTTSNLSNQVLYSTLANKISSIDFTIVATDTIANTRQTSKLFAGVLGEEVGYMEFMTIDIPISSPGVGDFKVNYATGNVTLTVTPTSNDLTTYKVLITSYKA